jgi:hypothetical protein
MTPEQRQAVVELWRSRRFPLHKPPRPDPGEGWYFPTAATFEHRHHFTAPNELTALERRLLEALQTAALPCAGWVVLPNQSHAPVQAPMPVKEGWVLGLGHGRSARYAKLRDCTPWRRAPDTFLGSPAGPRNRSAGQHPLLRREGKD